MVKRSKIECTYRIGSQLFCRSLVYGSQTRMQATLSRSQITGLQARLSKHKIIDKQRNV